MLQPGFKKPKASLGKKPPRLLRQGGGGHVPVIGDTAQQAVPYAAAHYVGLVLSLVQYIQYAPHIGGNGNRHSRHPLLKTICLASLIRANAPAALQKSGPRCSRLCRPFFIPAAGPSAFFGSEKEEMARRTRCRPTTRTRMPAPLFLPKYRIVPCQPMLSYHNRTVPAMLPLKKRKIAGKGSAGRRKSRRTVYTIRLVKESAGNGDKKEGFSAHRLPGPIPPPGSPPMPPPMPPPGSPPMPPAPPEVATEVRVTEAVWLPAVRV